MNLASRVSQIRQSIYAVLIERQHPQPGKPKVEVVGTAFSVSSEGVFLTADHVANPQNNTPAGQPVGPNDKILLAQMQADGVTASILGPFQIVASSQQHDFAILKIQTPHVLIQKYLELDLSSRFEGEEVAVCGYPLASTQQHPQNGSVTLNMSIRVAAGIISSQQIKNNSKELEVDFPILPGNSGGPIISIETGKVVGLAKATMTVGGATGHTMGHLGIVTDVRNTLPTIKNFI